MRRRYLRRPERFGGAGGAFETKNLDPVRPVERILTALPLMLH